MTTGDSGPLWFASRITRVPAVKRGGVEGVGRIRVVPNPTMPRDSRPQKGCRDGTRFHVGTSLIDGLPHFTSCISDGSYRCSNLEARCIPGPEIVEPHVTCVIQERVLLQGRKPSVVHIAMPCCICESQQKRIAGWMTSPWESTRPRLLGGTSTISSALRYVDWTFIWPHARRQESKASGQHVGYLDGSPAANLASSVCGHMLGRLLGVDDGTQSSASGLRGCCRAGSYSHVSSQSVATPPEETPSHV